MSYLYFYVPWFRFCIVCHNQLSTFSTTTTTTSSSSSSQDGKCFLWRTKKIRFLLCRCQHKGLNREINLKSGKQNKSEKVEEGSISPTIYKQLLCHFPFDKKFQTQIVCTAKLRKTLLFEKAARKMLVKLTRGEAREK